MEVILSNFVVTLKVFDPNLPRQEYSLNSAVTDVAGSKIMHKHDCLDDQMAKCGITWQGFFAVREHIVHSMHTPLTHLPQRCVKIRNVEEIVAHVTMKTSRCPFRDWPNKCTIHLTASGESLVNAYLKVADLTFHLMHKTCRQTSICPTSGKVNCRYGTSLGGPLSDINNPF